MLSIWLPTALIVLSSDTFEYEEDRKEYPLYRCGLVIWHPDDVPKFMGALSRSLIGLIEHKISKCSRESSEYQSILTTLRTALDNLEVDEHLWCAEMLQLLIEIDQRDLLEKVLPYAIKDEEHTTRMDINSSQKHIQLSSALAQKYGWPLIFPYAATVAFGDLVFVIHCQIDSNSNLHSFKVPDVNG